MVHIDTQLCLQNISRHDQVALLQLMSDIYPAVYAHLWEDAGQAYIERVYGAHQLATELTEPGQFYCFVMWNEKRIGILRIVIDRMPPDQDLPSDDIARYIYIQRIYLDPNYTRRGIGQKLFSWIVHEYCMEGTNLLWLEAMDTQKEALSFYQNIGFRISTHFYFQDGPMRPAYKGMYRLSKAVIKT